MSLAPELLPLLCDPATHEPLGLIEQDRALAALSGRRFPISSGIPVLLENADAVGQNARYQRLYDRLAPFYDLGAVAYALLKSGNIEKRRREYLDELQIGPGSRVLEVSVGTGLNLRFLPTSATYFGLDISMGMLRRCQRNLRRWHRDVALLVQAAAEHLPFMDAAFDSVLHMGGINFFTDKAQALCEMVRVAKPGSKIVVVDETDDFTRRHQKTPIAGSFYRDQQSLAVAPLEQLPPGMNEVQVKAIAGGELYCLSFRRPS